MAHDHGETSTKAVGYRYVYEITVYLPDGNLKTFISAHKPYVNTSGLVEILLEGEKRYYINTPIEAIQRSYPKPD